MKYRGKRYLGLLLSVLMIFSTFGYTGFALESEVTDDQDTFGEQVLETDGTEDGSVTMERGASAQSGQIRITNTSGDLIKIKGVMNGNAYERKLRNNETFDAAGLDSITAIYAYKVIVFEGAELSYTDQTLAEGENDGYSYCVRFDEKILASKNISFKVKADTKHFLIHFAPNYGEGAMPAQMVEKDKVASINACIFTKKDFAFEGWALDGDGKIKYADRGRISISKDIYLYAVWKTAGPWNIIPPEAVTGLVYNGEMQELITGGEVEGGVMKYNLDGGPYSSRIPKAVDAGTYVVGYKAIGYNNKKAKYGFVSVTIDKAAFEPVVEIESWTYGKRPCFPTVTGYYDGDEIDDDDVTYYYANADDPDSKAVTEMPTEPGYYSVYAVVDETDNYEGAVSGLTYFTISKAAIHPSVFVLSWKEGEWKRIKNHPVVIGNRGHGEVTFLYKEPGNSGEYEPFDPANGAPYAAGSYLLKAVISSSAGYEGAETEPYVFRIYQADPKVDQLPEGIPGREYIVDDEGVPVDQDLITPGYSTNDKGHFEYKIGKSAKVRPLIGYEDEIPVASEIGTYYIWYRFVDNSGLLPKFTYCDEPIVVTIGKATIYPVVNISGWTYGSYDEAVNSPVLDEYSNPGGGDVKYLYKAADADDSTYTEEIPVDVGMYIVKAEVSETEKYKSGTAFCEFMIDKAPSEWAVKGVEETYDGQMHELAEAATDCGVVEYEYKEGETTIYSETVPTARDTGMYEVVFRVKGDKNHQDTDSYKVTSVILPREVKFSWSDETSFVYDGKYHGVSAEAANLVSGDDLRIIAEDTEAIKAGNYTAAVTFLSGDDADNYTFDPDSDNSSLSWKIKKAALAVTANDKTINYGDAPSGAGVTYEGFAEGDTPETSLSGTVTYEFDYAKNGKPGTYSITPGGLTSVNYDIDYVDGELRVNDVESVLLLQGVSGGNTKVRLTWNSITGADKYVMYQAKCNTGKKKYTFKKVATFTGGKLTYTAKGLKKNTCNKFYVIAYKDGVKIAKSRISHVITGDVYGKYTNAASVKVKKDSLSIKKGSKADIKATETKVKSSKTLLNSGHAPKLRYTSSNTKVATVNGNGTVYARSKGYCRIFVHTTNGLWDEVEVTVK